MFNVNSRFYTFYTTLQQKLQSEFDLKALSEHACLLFSDHLPISIVFYSVAAAKHIPIESAHRCIHVDEDVWRSQPELLMNRIAALAGQATRIHARETVVARIDKATALSFQAEHHLQVALPGKYRYGLFFEGELMAIAVFSGGRKMHDKPVDYRSFELLRFCHKQGFHVLGGFSKLLSAFQEDVHPGDIMTYADKDWSDGESYRKTGFAIVGETVPQLFWIDTRTMKRYSDGAIPPTIVQKSANERKTDGYMPLYNSGSIKLVKGIL